MCSVRVGLRLKIKLTAHLKTQNALGCAVKKNKYQGAFITPK